MRVRVAPRRSLGFNFRLLLFVSKAFQDFLFEEMVDQAATLGKNTLANKEKLPPHTAGKTYSGKFVVRIGADLHKKAAVKAMTRGESLNQFVAEAIADA
jgi:predicted HicB family RNase H-like nuclease